MVNKRKVIETCRCLRESEYLISSSRRGNVSSASLAERQVCIAITQVQRTAVKGCDHFVWSPQGWTERSEGTENEKHGAWPFTT